MPSSAEAEIAALTPDDGEIVKWTLYTAIAWNDTPELGVAGAKQFRGRGWVDI